MIYTMLEASSQIWPMNIFTPKSKRKHIIYKYNFSSLTLTIQAAQRVIVSCLLGAHEKENDRR